MREERVVGREVDPVADLERRGFRLRALEGDGPMRGADLLDAGEPREEVEVPVAAARCFLSAAGRRKLPTMS